MILSSSGLGRGTLNSVTQVRILDGSPMKFKLGDKVRVKDKSFGNSELPDIEYTIVSVIKNKHGKIAPDFLIKNKVIVMVPATNLKLV